MTLQFAAVFAPADPTWLVILNPAGNTWSPLAGAFVTDYPADARIPLVRPAMHPEVLQAIVEGLPETRVFVYLAGVSGQLTRYVPFDFREQIDTETSLISSHGGLNTSTLN